MHCSYCLINNMYTSPRRHRRRHSRKRPLLDKGHSHSGGLCPNSMRWACVLLAAVLTLIYLVYQYWGLLFKGQEEEEDECHHTPRLSRSRSRSRTRSGNYHEYKTNDSKYCRRGRKAHRRCPDCSLCNFDQ
nr:uncharacterized protein LOC110380818 isoform X2 [Helicoverpa armigera]